ncbi:hypothetical protein PRZ48_003561 [Zasmidium cellare]|uniref:Endonuclease/exonuclease/phosphatase domain-containing protein n=1 Tax=Zasmidium cellare TaxID=395010 RepID=A0ABR0EXL6_ZASCE|nr:hypothetical protein PRZ48_003561 [Zasmidium cellare]
MAARDQDDISPPPIKRRKMSNSSPPSKTSSGVQRDELRIYSWNVNGIDPLVQRPITSFFEPRGNVRGSSGSTVSTGLRDVLRRYSWPTLLFLQEVKIAPGDESAMKAVERAIQPSADEPEEAPSYKAFFCLPKDKYNARGFGRKYGVCNIIRQDFFDAHVERVREVDWDLEGRFLVCETKPFQSLPKLAIINLYAVNGTDAPYKDPDTGKPFGTRHDRKLRVHRLLQAECQALSSRGFQIVLAGDFNIARAPIDGHPNLRMYPKQHCVNRADFEARFFRRGTRLGGGSEGAEKRDTVEGDGGEVDEGLGMIDSFRHLHGDKAGYTYHPRGKSFGTSCDRVDMILTSSSLRDHLAEAGIHETPADRATSDHVPLYISLLSH